MVRRSFIKEFLFGTRAEDYASYVTNYGGHFPGIVPILVVPAIIIGVGTLGTYLYMKENKNNPIEISTQVQKESKLINKTDLK